MDKQILLTALPQAATREVLLEAEKAAAQLVGLIASVRFQRQSLVSAVLAGLQYSTGFVHVLPVQYLGHQVRRILLH